MNEDGPAHACIEFEFGAECGQQHSADSSTCRPAHMMQHDAACGMRGQKLCLNLSHAK
jgi:hypothetical protein